MWRDLLVAMAVAGAGGLLSLLYDRYVFWRAYARKRFAAGIAGFALVNSLSGALAVALAGLLAWEPRPGEWAFNGLVYGLIGQGILRVEPRSQELRQVEAARSLLARTSDLIVRFLDSGAERRIQQRLSTLSDQRLYDQAMYLHGKFVADAIDVPRSAGLRQKEQLIKAAELLTGDEWGQGRGRLERHCLQEIAERQLHPDIAWAPVTPADGQ